MIQHKRSRETTLVGDFSIDDELYFTNENVHFDSAIVYYKNPNTIFQSYIWDEGDPAYRKRIDFNASTNLHFISKEIYKKISFTNCSAVNIDANVNSIYYANPVYVVAIADSVIKARNFFKAYYDGSIYSLDNNMSIQDLPMDKWYYYEYQKMVSSVLTTVKDTFYQGCTQRVITL